MAGFLFQQWKKKEEKKKTISVVWLDSKNLPMFGVFTNQTYKPNCAWLRLLTNHIKQEYCWCRFA
jgi:hypothetical protein